jgi:hypothetical protein
MTVFSLDELEAHIRTSLPLARDIQKLQKNAAAKYVEFQWHQRHFVVQPSLQVFENKDQKLFITGASMLIQACLLKKDKTQNVLSEVIDTMEKTEELVKSSPEQALALLGSVKATIRKLIQK